MFSSYLEKVLHLIEGLDFLLALKPLKFQLVLFFDVQLFLLVFQMFYREKNM